MEKISMSCDTMREALHEHILRSNNICVESPSNFLESTRFRSEHTEHEHYKLKLPFTLRKTTPSSKMRDRNHTPTVDTSMGRPLPGYQGILQTFGSPLRPEVLDCPICLEPFSFSATLTHHNGECNRSFHKTCWEQWITDFGTCPNCRGHLRDEDGNLLPWINDANFHAQTGFANLDYRERHNPLALTGQELLEYHVNWVLKRYHRRLDQERSVVLLPAPFGEEDVFRFWFNRRRAVLNTGIIGTATRWEDMLGYMAPRTALAQRTISEFYDLRLAFSLLATHLPRMPEIYHRIGGLTLAVFDPCEYETSVWEYHVAPLLRDENRDAVAQEILRWTHGVDQAYHLEQWLHPWEELQTRWERLVYRLDPDRNRE